MASTWPGSLCNGREPKTVLDRAAERCASQDRAFPKVPGLAASQLQGEMSTGPNRLKDGKSLSAATAHVATSSRRFGVKPTSGKVADIYAGESLAGQDDGSDYFAEYRAKGGLMGLPIPKTRSQDGLWRVCIAWIAGEREGWMRDLIREGIAKVETTDPEQASAFRTAMMSRDIWS